MDKLRIAVVAGRGDEGCSFPAESAKWGAMIARLKLPIIGLDDPGSYPLVEAYLTASEDQKAADWRSAILYTDTRGPSNNPKGSVVRVVGEGGYHVIRLVAVSQLVIVGPRCRNTGMAALLATKLSDRVVAIYGSADEYQQLVQEWGGGVGYNQILAFRTTEELEGLVLSMMSLVP